MFLCTSKCLIKYPQGWNSWDLPSSHTRKFYDFILDKHQNKNFGLELDFHTNYLRLHLVWKKKKLNMQQWNHASHGIHPACCAHPSFANIAAPSMLHLLCCLLAFLLHPMTAANTLMVVEKACPLALFGKCAKVREKKKQQHLNSRRGTIYHILYLYHNVKLLPVRYNATSQTSSQLWASRRWSAASSSINIKYGLPELP